MTTALEGVRGQRYAPSAFYSLERPDTPVQEAGWVPGPVWTGAVNLAPPEFDLRTVHPIVSRYTDWVYVCVCVCVYIYIHTYVLRISVAVNTNIYTLLLCFDGKFKAFFF